MKECNEMNERNKNQERIRWYIGKERVRRKEIAWNISKGEEWKEGRNEYIM